ncbi:unnamed protein product [Soboliphyme baturini]|uniref:Hydroxymethylglutaryl-CoA synthase n=1 Tax=Soboliphyme baturini TaxID=241478 RepID=A0A183INP0_9BILA|nr:unnamed protein product [Soboliphyme baturini]
MAWPQDVGILALEVYYPSMYVDQNELEEFDGASRGKYTIGLGQNAMGFCSDCEDVCSLALTVTQHLLECYSVHPSSIGYIAVGTESLIDKSKSVKTVLMQLFSKCGNNDVEGVDTINACFGGTQAMFSAINWIESSSWDGRTALVVMADIAAYAEPSARCTGGAGAVALLIGPNAPVVFDRGVRSFYMEHAYDFYKPAMSSEFPVIDGKLTIQCYLKALDHCYERYCAKAQKVFGKFTSFLQFDALLFHSPYSKLVQKSVARLSYLDMRRTPPFCSDNTVPEETYFNKDLEKAFMKHSAPVFNSKTLPYLLLSKNVGNMYTPSLYAALACFLAT